jgi:NAD(P)-dependent dehydrogenase (short-subunit alcohol dehydrogenase family)
LKRIAFIGSVVDGSGVDRVLRASGHRVVSLDPWQAQPSGGTGSYDGDTVDLADCDAVSRAIESCRARLGGLDALIFAAPVDAASTANAAHAAEAAEDGVASWRRTVAQLACGAFYCTQAALRTFVPQARGCIVYLCADRAIDGSAGSPALSAASCGVLALSSSLAASAFRHGITMNSVILGEQFDADGLAREADFDSDADSLAYATRRSQHAMREIVMRRHYEASGVGWAETVGGVLEHLLSAKGSLIAGSTLRLANVGVRSPFIRWSY